MEEIAGLGVNDKRRCEAHNKSNKSSLCSNVTIRCVSYIFVDKKADAVEKREAECW